MPKSHVEELSAMRHGPELHDALRKTQSAANKASSAGNRLSGGDAQQSAMRQTQSSHTPEYGGSLQNADYTLNNGTAGMPYIHSLHYSSGAQYVVELAATERLQTCPATNLTLSIPCVHIGKRPHCVLQLLKEATGIAFQHGILSRVLNCNLVIMAFYAQLFLSGMYAQVHCSYVAL